jgi:hypothetical protein
MAIGSASYRHALERLAAAGIPATFTQTGGMCAALEASLEGGYTLLITDADDVLPWEPSQRQGWGVGLYRPDNQHDEDPVAFGNTRDSSLAALLPLVRTVLAAGVQEELRRARASGTGQAPVQQLAGPAVDPPNGNRGRPSARSNTERSRTTPRELSPPSLGR